MDSLKASPSIKASTVWSLISAELSDQPSDLADRRVVDVGGGTGGFAVPLAQAGYDVTVVDPSPNALAGLTRRAAGTTAENHITAVQADADALPKLIAAGGARFVLCHSVLEMVDSPRAALEAIAAVLAPGGAASLVVTNKAGAVLSRMWNGHVTAANAILENADGSAGDNDTVRRRFDPASLTRMVTDSGLVPSRIHGLNLVADPGRDAEPGYAEALREFEEAVAAVPPYRDIAAQLHVLAHKPKD